MAFYVGQKVVCLVGCKPHVPPPRAVKNRIYQISEVFTDSEDGELMLQFVEMHFAGNVRWAPGFRAVNFRPVVERKTDISALRALLNTVPDEVLA